MDTRDSFRYNVLSAGHRACIGCGESIAARIVTDLIGPNAIYINSTGCFQGLVTNAESSAWQVATLMTSSMNITSVAAGMELALQYRQLDTPLVIQAGDGATMQMSQQYLSGIRERDHNILYICYDNESYFDPRRLAVTPTSHTKPLAESLLEKIGHDRYFNKPDLLSLIASHRIPYAASASIAFFPDLKAKVEKALEMTGFRFIRVQSPCPISWGFDPSQTVTISRLAVETGLLPVVEIEYGTTTAVLRLQRQRPVQDYLGLQDRFKHMLSTTGNNELRHLQALANSQIQHYGLLTMETEWDTSSALRVERFGRGGYCQSSTTLEAENATAG